MRRWIRRHRLAAALATAAALGAAALGVAGVTAFALAGGFDETTTVRVSDDGVRVVRVALVDRAVGYDVSPDVVEVEPGTRVVLEVVNEAGAPHDLAVGDGPRTAVLDPGGRERLDLGEVTDGMSGRCTIGDHDIGGMTLDLADT
jgi:nitrite reductase (NO-forming)